MRDPALNVAHKSAQVALIAPNQIGVIIILNLQMRKVQVSYIT